MSHGFEFFAFSGLIYATHQYWKSYIKKDAIDKSLLISSLAIGFFAVLALWIRPSNYNALFIPFLYLLFITFLRDKAIVIKMIPPILVSFLIFLIPFFVFNIYFFDAPFPSSEEVYGKSLSQHIGMPEGFNHKIIYMITLIPNIILILFSSEVGILYSAPVLFFGTIGFIAFLINFIKKTKSKKISIILFILSIIIFGLPVAIALAWREPAADYGYRYLFSLIPLSAIFFFYLWGLFKGKFNITKKILIAFLILGVVNVFFLQNNS